MQTPKSKIIKYTLIIAVLISVAGAIMALPQIRGIFQIMLWGDQGFPGPRVPGDDKGEEEEEIAIRKCMAMSVPGISESVWSQSLKSYVLVHRKVNGLFSFWTPHKIDVFAANDDDKKRIIENLRLVSKQVPIRSIHIEFYERVSIISENGKDSRWEPVNLESSINIKN